VQVSGTVTREAPLLGAEATKGADSEGGRKVSGYARPPAARRDALSPSRGCHMVAKSTSVQFEFS
jgi:hypothetical protein